MVQRKTKRQEYRLGEIDPRFEHGWAIVRIDDFLLDKLEGVAPEQALKIKKIVWSRAEADAEVQRLNRLQVSRGTKAHYLAQVVRVAKKP